MVVEYASPERRAPMAASFSPVDSIVGKRPHSAAAGGVRRRQSFQKQGSNDSFVSTTSNKNFRDNLLFNLGQDDRFNHGSGQKNAARRRMSAPNLQRPAVLNCFCS